MNPFAPFVHLHEPKRCGTGRKAEGVSWVLGDPDICQQSERVQEGHNDVLRWEHIAGSYPAPDRCSGRTRTTVTAVVRDGPAEIRQDKDYSNDCSPEVCPAGRARLTRRSCREEVEGQYWAG